MGRHRGIQTTLIALGAVFTLVGATGVISAFTDRATTGQNSLESGERPRFADLQLATWSMGPGDIATTCATFADDLTTGIYSATNLQPFDPFLDEGLCVRNVGASEVDVAMSVIDLFDVETGCTGDEAIVDATCEVGGIGEPSDAGELAPNIRITWQLRDCATNAALAGVAVTLTAMASTPEALGSLESGGTMCVFLEAVELPGTDEGVAAQSDEVTWRFAFDGTRA